MNIIGLQKMTLLDYPGHVACTVFLQGCNFKCPFCYNSSLINSQNNSNISLDEFHKMCSNEELFESTMYAGHAYGSKISDVKDILAKGKHVLTTMDICGAMSLKTNFPHVITVYIKRDKKILIESILKKNSTIEDKINRLICIEDEKNNEDICDYVISYDSYDEAVEEIINTLNLK